VELTQLTQNNVGMRAVGDRCERQRLRLVRVPVSQDATFRTWTWNTDGEDGERAGDRR
jgi:hypothetical protein